MTGGSGLGPPRPGEPLLTPTRPRATRAGARSASLLASAPVDNAHVEAWKNFYADAFGRLGLRLRPDVSWDDLAHALHAAGEGGVFRALLPETKQGSPSA